MSSMIRHLPASLTTGRSSPSVEEITKTTIHQGFLEKQGNQQLKAKDWQPRWCMLTQRGLYYFRQRGASSAAGHIIFQEGVEVLVPAQSERQFVFQLRVPSGRVYSFQALDNNELQTWVNLLRETLTAAVDSLQPSALSQGTTATSYSLATADFIEPSSSSSSSSHVPERKATSPAALDRSTVRYDASPAGSLSPRSRRQTSRDDHSSAVDSAATNIDGASKYGVLRKEGEKVKSWHRRWFVLTGAQLCYYKTPQDRTPLGRINMLLASVRVPERPARRYSFEVVTPTRTYFIQAETPRELDEWTRALVQATTDAITQRQTHMFSASGQPNIAKLHLQTYVMQLPGNDTCCDCGQPAPNWASINLGIFLCIGCAGVHRSLGVDISQVRSTQLDSSSWDADTVAWMEAAGNNTVNSILREYQKPFAATTTPNREQLIRAKYTPESVAQLLKVLRSRSTDAAVAEDSTPSCTISPTPPTTHSDDQTISLPPSFPPAPRRPVPAAFSYLPGPMTSVPVRQSQALPASLEEDSDCSSQEMDAMPYQDDEPPLVAKRPAPQPPCPAAVALADPAQAFSRYSMRPPPPPPPPVEQTESLDSTPMKRGPPNKPLPVPPSY